MHAVCRNRGVRAGSLGEHDVARVVHEAGNRMGRGTRGQRQQHREGERDRESSRHSSGRARYQPTAVVAASASQMTALARHQAQYAWILNAWSPAR